MNLPGIPRPAPRVLKVGLFGIAVSCFIAFSATDWGILAVLAIGALGGLIGLVRRDARGDEGLDIGTMPAPIQVNPSTGLPMIQGTNVDVMGTPVGLHRNQ